jgi:hypothetical protein
VGVAGIFSFLLNVGNISRNEDSEAIKTDAACGSLRFSSSNERGRFVLCTRKLLHCQSHAKIFVCNSLLPNQILRRVIMGPKSSNAADFALNNCKVKTPHKTRFSGLSKALQLMQGDRNFKQLFRPYLDGSKQLWKNVLQTRKFQAELHERDLSRFHFNLERNS